MARLIATIVLLAALAVPGIAHADEYPSQEVFELAEEANVNAFDLLGALNTTRSEPRAYLIAVGHLAPPVPPPPPFGIWDQLAGCESGGNWAANTGNGYFGGIQFDQDSWYRAGGVGRPDHASRTEQIKRGQIWQQAIGWAKGWPACSWRLGFR